MKFKPKVPIINKCLQWLQKMFINALGEDGVVCFEDKYGRT